MKPVVNVKVRHAAWRAVVGERTAYLVYAHNMPVTGCIGGRLDQHAQSKTWALLSRDPPDGDEAVETAASVEVWL